jgi:hypothetical protein
MIQSDADESVETCRFNSGADHSLDSLPQTIKGIIVTLRLAIDQIDSAFKQARDLILEIAKRLDEGGLCATDQVSITIKRILKDKIKEGKITEKWIEECLAPEYKRQYTKSELSSLSDNSNKRKIPKVLVSTIGASGEVSSGIHTDTNNISSNSPLNTKSQKPLLSVSKTEETNCVRCKQLEEALLRASKVVSEDKFPHEEDKKYQIVKEQFALVKAVMNGSRQFCKLTFGRDGRLSHAEPDSATNI